MTTPQKRKYQQFIPGSTFGKWTLLSRADKNEAGCYRFLCKCECGREQLVWGTSLRSRRSAGCRKCADVNGAKKRIKHGYTVNQTKSSKALYARFYRYGVTPEEFTKVLERQFHMCAICTGTLKKEHRKPHLDHCHRTGIFRGILCQGCNTGLGYFSNSPTKLKRAIKYLTNVIDARMVSE